MRDQFKPSKRECRELVGIYLIEKVSDVEKDLTLHFLIEAVTHVYSCQDVHKHTVKWLLVEVTSL
jgi:hypothetical protein